MNRVFRNLFSLAVTVILSVSGDRLFAGPSEDPETFSQDDASGKTVMSYREGYQLVLERFYNAPVKGSEAPELNLFDPIEGKDVELDSLVGEKPTVLLFGSYGCDVLHRQIEGVRSCLEDFGERANFVFVYIREAHSLESNEVSENPETNTPLIADPTTLAERGTAAQRWMEEKEISFRVLIDSMKDEGATRWAGWPVRLYVVDNSRTVIYSGKPGPWGFFPAPGEKAEGYDRMRKHEDRFSQESLHEFLEGYFGEAEKAGVGKAP